MRIATIIAAMLISLAAWYLHRSSAASATARVSSVAPAAASAAVAPTAAPALPAQDDDDPTPVVDATHAAMQQIGHRCFATRTPRAQASNQPDDTVGRLELRLRIRIASGIASVETADVVTTRRLRDELRDCIVAHSRTASWSVSATDGVHDVVELFRMGDFVDVPRPDSPPSAFPTR